MRDVDDYVTAACIFAAGFVLGVLPIQRNKSAWLAALEQSRHLFYHLHGKYFGMRQQHCSQQEQEYYDED